jgi:FKBP-type peptidyl-prolyl cis-trans isomerase 2
MQIGEKTTLRLTSEQAYGPYRPELVMTVDRSDLPEGSQPTPGQQLQMRTESGNPLVVVVTQVTETTVTLDANHSLSGQNLTFEIELVGIEQGQAASGRTY